MTGLEIAAIAKVIELVIPLIGKAWNAMKKAEIDPIAVTGEEKMKVAVDDMKAGDPTLSTNAAKAAIETALVVKKAGVTP